jgi:uncharacterized membrane protein YkvA (DUF1232 family)
MNFAGASFWNRGDDGGLRQNFWRKLVRVIAQIPFAEDLLAAYYCAFDKDTPAAVKATLVAAIAYFVLPTDAIPDFIPVIGYGDDATVLAAAVKIVSDHIRPLHRQAARAALTRL